MPLPALVASTRWWCSVTRGPSTTVPQVRILASALPSRPQILLRLSGHRCLAAVTEAGTVPRLLGLPLVTYVDHTGTADGVDSVYTPGARRSRGGPPLQAP